MTLRETFLAALRGQEAIAFSARAWWRLPAFLNSEERPDWWLDAGYCTRALADLATLCGLEAIQIPLLRTREGLTGGEMPPPPAEPYEALAARAEVGAALAVVDQLTRLDRHGVLGVLPSVPDMLRRWPDESPEELQDDTSEVVSHLFALGADGVIIHGTESADVRATMDPLARLAKHFGRVVLGVTPWEAWSTDSQHAVFSVSPQGPWATIRGGVVLATVDLSLYSPRELKPWLDSRPRAG